MRFLLPLLILSVLMGRSSEASCSGIRGAELKRCQQEELKMISETRAAEEDFLRQDRLRVLKFSAGSKIIQATAGELNDLSSKHIDLWVFIYGQKSGNYRGVQFDIAAICRKFSSLQAEIKDENIQIPCRKGRVHGIVRYHPVDHPEFQELRRIENGQIKASASRSQGKLISKNQYCSPTWLVSQTFQAGKLFSRTEIKNRQREGINFDQPYGKKFLYKRGRVIGVMKKGSSTNQKASLLCPPRSHGKRPR